MQSHVLDRKMLLNKWLKIEHVSLIGWLCLHLLTASKQVCMSLLLLGLFNMWFVLKKLYNFQPGLIVGIFISFYLVYLIPVFFYDVPIASHHMFNTLENYKLSLSIFVLFVIMINMFLKKVIAPVIIAEKIKPIKSFPIFSIFSLIQVGIIIQVLITAASIGGNASYDQYINNLESSNGLWEYFYIIYVLSYLFSPNRFCKRLLIVIFIAYVYVSITRGYRIQMIQMCILFFILFLDGKFKNYAIILLSFFGLLIMEVYGLWKVIGAFDLEKILSSYETFDKILISNQTEVFYSTTGVIARLRSGYFGIEVQIETFCAFILNFIWPSGFLWEKSRVLDHMYDSDIGGGGFCFGYFYFWFGLAGVVLIAYFISWNLNNHISNSIPKLVYLILFLSLCPRWFAYEPTNNLIRLPLTLVIILMITLAVFNRRMVLRSKVQKDSDKIVEI